MEQKINGMILGGLIGDAFGSRYEFQTAEKVSFLLIEDKINTIQFIGQLDLRMILPE